MADTIWWKRSYHWAKRLLAKSWLKLHPGVRVIGITGSYGKTNTTRTIAVVLKEKFDVLQTDINLDTVYNLPITLLKLRSHQKMVLEYGVDHQGEMDFHLSLVKPSIGVVTGINPTHSDPGLLGSLEGVIKEKVKLLKALPRDGWAILNRDDKAVQSMAKKTKAQVWYYGLTEKSDFWADKIKVGFKNTSFVLHHGGQAIAIKTGLIGRHFVYSCLAAAAVGRIEGLTWKQIKDGLAKLKPFKGRVSIEKGPLGSVLINDALRANPASTLAGLRVLADLPTKGRRIAILGEMGELGSSAKSEHQRVGQELAKLKLNYLIGVGGLQKHTTQTAIKAGMLKKNVFWTANVVEATRVLKKILKTGDLLYLKGSLLRHMERIILLLKGEKVCCRLVSCHHYDQCLTCSDLKKDD